MDKVLCPWCGREIEIRFCSEEGGVFDSKEEARRYVPYDELCFGLYHPRQKGIHCPIASYEYETLGTKLYDKEEEAYAAIRRPLQKPLSLEEACGSEEPCVYYESKLNDHLMAVNVIESKSAFFDPHTICEIRWIGSGDVKYMLTGDYGDKWRCWATKPTQEEREEARWE